MIVNLYVTEVWGSVRVNRAAGIPYHVYGGFI
jgi:hypothetical protein